MYYTIYEHEFGKHWKESVKAVTLFVFCWWKNDWTIIRWRTNLRIGEEPASRFDQERGDITLDLWREERGDGWERI